MRFYAAAALALSTLATPAFAQDAEPATFGGLKVAAVGGVDQPRVPGIRGRGFIYGATVGYDVQSGRLLFGPEGEATWSTADGCDPNVQDPCFKAKRDLYAGGRVGVAVGENFAVYAKAGYTTARLGATVLGVDAGSTNLDGLRVGGGVEAGSANGVFGRFEYRYSNYENDVRRHQIVGAIGYRF